MEATLESLTEENAKLRAEIMALRAGQMVGGHHEAAIPQTASSMVAADGYFLKKLIELLPGILSVFDFQEQRNVFINRSITSLLGYDPEEIKNIGVSVMQTLMHPEDQPRFQAHLDKIKILQDGEYVDFEHRMRDREGHWHWFHSRDTVFNRDPDGSVRQIITKSMDITGRKEAENASAASELRFRAMADAIPQLAWVTRPDGHITWYNRRWYDYTGTTLAEMEGWGWQTVHDPELLPRVVAEFTSSLEKGENFEMIFPLRGADGIFRPFLTRALPIRDEEGKVIQWFGTNTDISELKRVENELTEAKLLADVANRSKDHFIATLSHELRTPLNPAMLATNLLASDPTLSPEAKEDVQMIRRNLELLARLIDDLLDVSRITAGKLVLNRQTVDLNRVIRDVCQICQTQIEEKQVRLETYLAPEAGLLAADPARLRQILWNVLRNASKFTPAQGHIQIRTARLPGDRCEVRVRDSGIGIASEYLSKIFSAFDQGESQITNQFGGMGLGLAICQALTQLHGGSIRAESEGVGLGAEFIIELPGLPSGASV